ncbi:MAG TPA: DUF4262 domain-containing protein [Frankiaceae bacterium]|nr:DUF4262 domain-containing protein [Frankiaceae bacterium]
MRSEERRRVLESIRANVARTGHHVTLVHGGRTPRFAYSIGLTERGLPEVVLAGATSLGGKAVKRALDEAVAASRSGGGSLAAGGAVEVPGVGAFEVGSVDPSWARRLLLGVRDYYDRDDPSALQLVPEGAVRTIDVPDMSRAWDPAREPVWRWLDDASDLPVAPDAVAVTNLDALRGSPISEAARWEEDQWEMFAGAGPDVPPDDVRVVPLATLLAFDPSLEPVTRLEVGRALRRDPPGPWESWG